MAHFFLNLCSVLNEKCGCTYNRLHVFHEKFGMNNLVVINDQIKSYSLYIAGSTISIVLPFVEIRLIIFSS